MTFFTPTDSHLHRKIGNCGSPTSINIKIATVCSTHIPASDLMPRTHNTVLGNKMSQQLISFCTFELLTALV